MKWDKCQHNAKCNVQTGLQKVNMETSLVLAPGHVPFLFYRQEKLLQTPYVNSQWCPLKWISIILYAQKMSVQSIWPKGDSITVPPDVPLDIGCPSPFQNFCLALPGLKELLILWSQSLKKESESPVALALALW